MQLAVSQVTFDQQLRQLPGLVAETWDWDQALVEPRLSELEQTLAIALRSRRWFGSKTRSIAQLQIIDSLPVTRDGRLLLVAVAYDEGLAEVYQLALAFADPPQARALAGSNLPYLWMRSQLDDGQFTGVLYDPTCQDDFCQALLHLIAAESEVPAAQGTLRGTALGSLAAFAHDDLTPRPVAAEQSNSSILYGQQLILKLFRKVDRGRNPDFEVSVKLTDRGFAHGAAVAGVLEYQTADPEPWTLGLLQRFVPNQGDAWHYTLRQLGEILEHATGAGAQASDQWPAHGSLLSAARQPLPPGPRAAFGPALHDAELLGRRTAQMHHALAAVSDDPSFAPEPFSGADGEGFRARALELLDRCFAALHRTLPVLDHAARATAERVLHRRAAAAARFDRMGEEFGVAKIRCHGDYHLGQVLVSNGDFVIIDFEGEPARPLEERRQKQLALRDVAGMVRSYHYAACTAATAARAAAPRRAAGSDARARSWLFWCSTAFLAGYRHAAGAAPFLPAADAHFERLFEACLLDKAIYELLYELNNRPDWVYLPLDALDEMLAPNPTAP